LTSKLLKNLKIILYSGKKFEDNIDCEGYVDYDDFGSKDADVANYFDSEEVTSNEEFQNGLYSGEEYEDNIDCEVCANYDDFVSQDSNVTDYEQMEREIQMYEKMDKILWNMEHKEKMDKILREREYNENQNAIQKIQLMSHLAGLLDVDSPTIPDDCFKNIYDLFVNGVRYGPTNSVEEYYFNLYHVSLTWKMSILDMCPL
jgi:hypothetical protein